jgi:hypothetical protein
MQKPFLVPTAFNGPAAQAAVPYGEYTQFPGGFGRLGGNGGKHSLPFADSLFFFPQNSQFFSNQVPTIGTALPRSSTSSIRTVDPITSTSTTGTDDEGGEESGNESDDEGGDEDDDDDTCAFSVADDLPKPLTDLDDSALVIKSDGGNAPSESKKILAF